MAGEVSEEADSRGEAMLSEKNDWCYMSSTWDHSHA